MPAFRKVLLLAALVLGVSGCTTIRGSQDALAELQPRNLIGSEEALLNYHHPSDARRGGLSRRAYRDYVVSSYLNALDARYTALVDALESGERGHGLFSDLLLLSLTGATSLVGAADVDELATVTAIAAGGRATVDQRLFFDRTLPAVIAGMDAQRTIIRAEIARKRNLPIEQYSLDDALDDLQLLQRAGRLTRGVARITQIAEADRAAQQARLDAISAACDDVTVDAARLNQEFRLLMTDNGNAAKPERLALAAQELALEIPEGQSPTWSDVRLAFANRLCDDDAKTRFIANVRSRIEAAEADAAGGQAETEGGGNGGD